MKSLSYMIFVVFVGFVLFSGPVTADDSPRQPGQPAVGPGGSDYDHENVRDTRSGFGTGAYRIFYPTSPVPDHVRPVLFLHGWGVIPSSFYRGWIDHLVRRGHVVIYPAYQQIWTPPSQFTDHAIQALKSAMEEIESTDSIPRVVWDQFVITGHSAGGTIAINMADRSGNEAYPEPAGLFLVQPGRVEEPVDLGVGTIEFPLRNMNSIPDQTRIILSTGDRDEVVSDRTAKEIYGRLNAGKREDTLFLEFQSDDTGVPPIVADHASPLAVKKWKLPCDISIDWISERSRMRVDALDTGGYWQVLDLLVASIRNDEMRFEDLPEREAFLHLGSWSSGKPISPARRVRPNSD